MWLWLTQYEIKYCYNTEAHADKLNVDSGSNGGWSNVAPCLCAGCHKLRYASQPVKQSHSVFQHFMQHPNVSAVVCCLPVLQLSTQAKHIQLNECCSQLQTHAEMLWWLKCSICRVAQWRCRDWKQSAVSSVMQSMCQGQYDACKSPHTCEV